MNEVNTGIRGGQCRHKHRGLYTGADKHIVGSHVTREHACKQSGPGQDRV